jgi:Tetratricopeptide repeat
MVIARKPILKNRIGIALLLGGFALFSGAPGIRAQTVTLYPAASSFNPIDLSLVSPRAAAMGSAFAGVADDASALWINPAGLARLSQIEIGALSDLAWVGSFRESLLTGLPVPGVGGIGLSAVYQGYGSFNGRDDLGSPAPDYNANEIQGQAGLGLGLVPFFSIGGSFRYVQESIAGIQNQALVPDLGLLAGPVSGWKMGLDWAVPLEGTGGAPLASTLRMGISWDCPVDSTIGLLVALGDIRQSDSLNDIQAGAEISFASTFFIRGGYQSGSDEAFSGPSLGAGLDIQGLRLDYAYLPGNDLGEEHQLSVIVSLGSSAPIVSPSGQLKASVPPGTSGNSTPSISANPGAPPAHAIDSSATTLSVPGGTNPPLGSGSSESPPSGLALSPGGALTVLAAPTATPDSLNLLFEVPPDYVAQGAQLESQNHPIAAIQAYEKAIAQDSQNVQAWWSLARLYYHLNQKAYALQCFNTVLSLRPDAADLKDWLNQYESSKEGLGPPPALKP